MNLTKKELEIILESLRNRMKRKKEIVETKPEIYTAANKIAEELKTKNTKNDK